MFCAVYKERFLQTLDTQISFEHMDRMNFLTIVAVLVVVLDRSCEVFAQYPPPAFCSPPRCPPGCFVQRTFSGPCPGCDCPPPPPFMPPVYPPPIPCSPPKCPPGCVVERDFSGPCPGCDCPPPPPPVYPPRILCSPPKCSPGCVVERDFSGPCPGCECPPTPPPPTKFYCPPPRRCRNPCFLVPGVKCPFCHCPYP